MKSKILILLMILSGTTLFGQAVLRKTDAIDLALKSNFDIREAICFLFNCFDRLLTSSIKFIFDSFNFDKLDILGDS